MKLRKGIRTQFCVFPKMGPVGQNPAPNFQDMGKLRTESRDPLPTGLLEDFRELRPRNPGEEE